MTDFDGEENFQTDCEKHSVVDETDESSANAQWEEVIIKVPWGHVSGKWYGNRDEQPILALHGWMDNAGSFDKLIPLLPKKFPVWSIDLPGHGKSSHFPCGTNITLFWDYIPVIRRIVKHFDWKKLKLMGHSMGGGVCFMYAASFPQDVEQLILLDTYGPLVRNPRTDASITGSSIDRVLAIEASIAMQPQYSREEFTKIMLDVGLIDRDSAQFILKRNLNKVTGCDAEEKYTISTDPRLKFAALGLLTLEQVLTYAARIQCPVLAIRAKPGIKFDRPETYQQVLNILRNNVEVDYHENIGSHYLHLQSPEKISGIISEFLLNVNYV